MSRAYKCDSCKRHHDGEPQIKLTVPQGWTTGTYWTPAESMTTVELCDTCEITLRRAFRALNSPNEPRTP